MRRCSLLVLLSLAAGALASPQGPPPPRGGLGGPGRDRGPDRGPDRKDSFGGPDSFSGKWWTNPSVIRRLNLTPDQQRRVEDVFQQNRVKLIDLTAALEKEEAILEPMLNAEHPAEQVVLAQIDRVADARAALEKVNARMLFGFRNVLTLDQWNALQSQGGRRPPDDGPPRPPK